MSLNEVYGDYAPSLSVLKDWQAKFKHDQTSIFDGDQPLQMKRASKNDWKNPRCSKKRSENENATYSPL